jgi:hypothetical protein
VVRKCLAKDPDGRWQSARDLHDELAWIAESESKTSASTVPATRSTRLHRVVWASIMVGTTAALALGVTRWLSEPTEEIHPIRFTVSSPPDAILGSSNTGQNRLAISPDGRRIAFLALRNGVSLLWVRALDAPEAQVLEATEGAGLPFWSPDSRMLGFQTPATLKVVDASGGPVRTVAERGGLAGGIWGAGGDIVFGSGAGLFRVPASGGALTPLARIGPGEVSHRTPAFLPDGRHVLYRALPSGTIWVASLDGTAPVQLVAADSQARFAPPGVLLFVRQGTLLAQPFDTRGMRPSGDAIPVAEQVVNVAGVAGFDASAGVLAYRTLPNQTTRLTWFDRAGKALRTVGQPGVYRNPVLSPDGTRVAVEVTDPQA